MYTHLPLIDDLRPRVFHFNTLQEGRYPLCGQSAADDNGPTRGYYTRDAARATCKKCLRSLASQAK